MKCFSSFYFSFFFLLLILFHEKTIFAFSEEVYDSSQWYLFDASSDSCDHHCARLSLLCSESQFIARALFHRPLTAQSSLLASKNSNSCSGSQGRDLAGRDTKNPHQDTCPCVAPPLVPSKGNINPNPKPPVNVPIKPTLVPLLAPSRPPTPPPTADYDPKPPIKLPILKPIIGPPEPPNDHPSVEPTYKPSPQPLTIPTKLPIADIDPAPKEKLSKPTLAPFVAPSEPPSSLPTVQPTAIPSSKPLSTLTKLPTADIDPNPKEKPTSRPLVAPTELPSVLPIAMYTTKPSLRPSIDPTVLPTADFDPSPKEKPSSRPLISPSEQPFPRPTTKPIREPTLNPSSATTEHPTNQPSAALTANPTSRSSIAPSEFPTASPLSSQSSASPSGHSDAKVTAIPSLNPSIALSETPTARPVLRPTEGPSSSPSATPSLLPIIHSYIKQPTALPSNNPLVDASLKPSSKPFAVSSEQPTIQITSNPTVSSSSKPSSASVVPSLISTLKLSEIPTSKPSTAFSEQNTVSPSLLPSVMFSPSPSPSYLPTTKSSSDTFTASSQPSSSIAAGAPMMISVTDSPSNLASTLSPSVSPTLLGYLPTTVPISGISTASSQPTMRLTGMPSSTLDLRGRLSILPTITTTASAGNLIPSPIPSSTTTNIPTTLGSTTANQNLTYPPSGLDQCRTETPLCDSSRFDCSAFLIILVQQGFENANITSTGEAFDVVFCAASSLTNLSTASFHSLSLSSRRRLSSGGQSLMLVYTIKIQPQAEGFATSAAAFQSIALKLNASVQSGAFTMALNAISAASSHVLDAPAASNYISIEYYPGVGMPTASPQAFNSTIASASSQGGGPQNTDSEILVIAIIAAIVGLCLLGAGCIVAIRKINFLSQRKKEANIKAERTIMPEDTMQPYRNYVFDEDDLIDL